MSRLRLVRLTLGAACCSLALSLSATPRAAAVSSVVASLVKVHGGKRCSLAALGEQLRVQGVDLPDGVSLSDFVAESDELQLSGPRNHRMVGFIADNTESGLVERVCALLREHGPMTSVEIKLRLRAERQRVPALMSLLRTHASLFAIHDGTVHLAVVDDDPSSPMGAVDTAVARSAAGLCRLRALQLPDSMEEHTLAALDALDELIVIDLDNKAFGALERATLHAADREDVFILAGCSAAHNPRVPQPVAAQLEELAAAGRLRLLSPARDCPNGADFVLAFWAGWLHARARDGARLVLFSEDKSLEHTLSDLLRGEAREVVCNPEALVARTAER